MAHPKSTGVGPNPSGICQCGCGESAPIAKRTNTCFGHVKGEPVRFLPNHHRSRGRIDNYVIEDRGYKTPCWIWQGYLTFDGYGRCKVNRKVVGVHVAMYEREIGPVPTGMDLDHLCRVPACINPEHVEPVTNAENVRRGLSARLDAAKVQEIKALLPHLSDTEIGKRYGVVHSTIWWIRKGINWKDV